MERKKKMSIKSFFERNVVMKVTRKYSRIGAEVRCSREYLREMFRLIHKGYDVYDQIEFDSEIDVIGRPRNKGKGILKLVGVPNLKESDIARRELRFTYKYSWWNTKIKFELEEERESREIAKIIQDRKSNVRTSSESTADTESVDSSEEHFQL
jgi:hypothetical protein